MGIWLLARTALNLQTWLTVPYKQRASLFPAISIHGHSFLARQIPNVTEQNPLKQLACVFCSRSTNFGRNLFCWSA
jgi:hypothetical protein